MLGGTAKERHVAPPHEADMLGLLAGLYELGVAIRDGLELLPELDLGKSKFFLFPLICALTYLLICLQ